MKSVGRDSVEPKLDCLGKSHGSTESRPTVIDGEIKRAGVKPCLCAFWRLPSWSQWPGPVSGECVLSGGLTPGNSERGVSISVSSVPSCSRNSLSASISVICGQVLEKLLNHKEHKERKENPHSEWRRCSAIRQHRSFSRRFYHGFHGFHG